ncbi:hypothetical protein FG386_000732 [Cryptosporidium ryanae]|uniref:uncharacterized protein n=1 Tax=Cryptosporidium ryanae TaxID=515981 RepID=UPI00351A6B47|nr:hypothetical protein FG386_000732 [Cryptosporidium ryanae]
MSELDINTEILDTLTDISKLLNTGLDMESMLVLIRLIELGVYPETLADIIINIRKEIAMVKLEERTRTLMNNKEQSTNLVFSNNCLSKGSLAQSIVVLWASISPSAALLLPSCMKETGIIIGLLIMFFSCFVLSLTQFILINSAAILSTDNYGNTLLKAFLLQVSESPNTKENVNVEKLSRYKQIIALFVNLPVFFAMAVTLPCFLIIWCSCIEQVLPPFSTYTSPTGVSYNQVSLMVICAAFMFPFSLKKELQATRYISWLSIIAGIFFSITVVKYYYSFAALIERGNVIWWKGDVSIVSCMKMLTISCFAFSNHENSPATGYELTNPTTIRTLILSGTVSLSIFSLFSIITVFSYLTFGELTMQTVVLNYNNGSSLVILSKIFLSVSNLVACTLSLHAATSSLINIILIIGGNARIEVSNDQFLLKKFVKDQSFSRRDYYNPNIAFFYIEGGMDTNNLLEDSITTIDIRSPQLYKQYKDKTNPDATVSRKTSNTIIYRDVSEQNELEMGIEQTTLHFDANERELAELKEHINIKLRGIIVFIFLSSSIFIATVLHDLLLLVEVATGFFETIICLIFPLLVYLKLFNYDLPWNKYYTKVILIILTLICSLGCFTASILAIN